MLLVRRGHLVATRSVFKLDQLQNKESRQTTICVAIEEKRLERVEKFARQRDKRIP